MKLSSIMMAAAVAACLGVGSIAQATPTVTYTLVIGQNNGGATNVPGQWTLYADDSVGDNIGIAAMSVGIVAHINQATAATDLRIFNDMPQSNYTDSSGNASPNPLNAGFVPSNTQITQRANQQTL